MTGRDALTEDGRSYAERVAEKSIVARVALGQEEAPPSHVETAVLAVNQVAADEAARKGKAE